MLKFVFSCWSSESLVAGCGSVRIRFAEFFRIGTSADVYEYSLGSGVYRLTRKLPLPVVPSDSSPAEYVRLAHIDRNVDSIEHCLEVLRRKNRTIRVERNKNYGS